MNQSVKLLTYLAALAIATPALAQNGERDSTYATASYFTGFQYQPLQVQIEGGPTFGARAASTDFDSGSNVGLGLTWQPTSHLPLAVRVDGMYERFDDRPAFRAQEAAALATAVDWGNTSRPRRVLISAGAKEIHLPRSLLSRSNVSSFILRSWF